MQIRILYEDNHVLGIDKPAGLLSQEDRTGDPTAAALGKDYLRAAYRKPGNVYLAPVHRLDRPASGAMVLARTSKAARRLSAAFRARRVEKRYLALAAGTLEGVGTWEDYLVKESRHVRIAKPGYPGAKHAFLRWKACGYQDGISLVDISMHTGRPHQVRAQFAHRGHPLLGDVRYGAKRLFDGRNLTLHCYYLAAPHPVRDQPLVLVAPLPATWIPFLDRAHALPRVLQQADAAPGD